MHVVHPIQLLFTVMEQSLSAYPIKHHMCALYTVSARIAWRIGRMAKKAKTCQLRQKGMATNAATATTSCTTTATATATATTTTSCTTPYESQYLATAHKNDKRRTEWHHGSATGDSNHAAAMLQREEEYRQLKQENETLREEMERLQARKAEHEETEHELRLILEEYKFTQLSHKQEMNSLQNTISTYKKASDSKGKSLDTLSNEYETTRNEKKLLTKQNTSLKQQMTQYLNQNTSLKEQLIESKAQCDALTKETRELKEQLALSQQLSNPISIDNIDAPVVPKPKPKADGCSSEVEQRLQRVYNMIQGDNKEMRREIEMVMEALHPLNMDRSIQSNVNVQVSTDSTNTDVANTGDNYVITKEEYADIEKVIDDRDAYLNKVRVYEKNMKALADKYQDLQRRMKEVNEEKSLMMRTLKESVQKLADENNQIRGKMSSLKDERSSIKEHDLKTQNDFYKLYEENRERKFEMDEMKQQIQALHH
eukprot:961632_1